MTPLPAVLPSPRIVGLVWLAAVGLAALAGALTHAGEVRVPFDSYYYIEFAKEFRTTTPRSFGLAWPFGWPLLGAAAGWVGLGAYPGLVVLAGAAWAGVVALCARHWPWTQTGAVAGALFLAALATTPATLQFIVSVFSEVPFALALLGFALSLARWPEPRAVGLSSGLALLALSLRYVGAVCFLLLAVQALRLHRAHRLPRGAAAGLLAAFAAGGALLLWNRLATGYWGGAPRGGGEPLAAWPGIAADFGWSLPTLLFGLRARDLLAFDTALGPLLGGGALAAVAAIAGRALRGQDERRRALGATILAYAGAMIALRCIGKFDALHNARTGLPLLAPLLLLLAPALPRRAALILPAGWLLLNLLFFARGPNLAASADVAPVLPSLRALGPDEFVSANDEARTLSAHLDQRVHRIESLALRPALAYGAAVVLAAAPDGPGAGVLPATWRGFAGELAASGRYRIAFDSPALVLLERAAPRAR